MATNKRTCISNGGIAAFGIVGMLMGSTTSSAQVSPSNGIRLSKETTFLKTPVRKDGFVDYTAALNAKLSKGVTPRNNAAARIAEIMGPEIYDESIRKRFFKQLGVKQPDDRQPRFLSMSRFARRGRVKANAARYASRLYKEQSAGAARPWSRREFPRLAAWLGHNQKPLAAIVEAIKRPKWYCPVAVSNEDFDGILIAALMPLQQETRSIARALSCRAMLAVQEGRIADAQQDLLSCHRLGRHVAQGFSLIEALVGYAIEAIACRTEVAMLQTGKLTRKQLNDYQSALKRLPPISSISPKIRFGERLTALDSVRYVIKHRVKGLKALTELTESSGVRALKLLNANMDLVEWNVVLKMLNDEFDRVHTAVSKPSYSDRRKAFLKLTTDYKKVKSAIRSPKTLADVTKAGKVNPEKLTELMGQVLITLFLPATHASRTAEDRTRTRADLCQIGFALEAYRKANGRFPATLQKLRPRYLKEIPTDRYSGKAPIYRRGSGGYVLYSVGADQKDDKGRTFDSTPRGDDVVIKVELK